VSRQLLADITPIWRTLGGENNAISLTTTKRGGSYHSLMFGMGGAILVVDNGERGGNGVAIIADVL